MTNLNQNYWNENDIFRAVTSINTAKRKKVFKQVQNVMAHKVIIIYPNNSKQGFLHQVFNQVTKRCSIKPWIVLKIVLKN